MKSELEPFVLLEADPADWKDIVWNATTSADKNAKPKPNLNVQSFTCTHTALGAIETRLANLVPETRAQFFPNCSPRFYRLKI